MLAEGSVPYSMAMPVEAAIEAVCNSLRKRGIRLAGQLDVSGRLEESLGIVLPPCRLLFVLPGPASSNTGTIHPSAAVFLPLHVVISGNRIQSEIRIANGIQAEANAAPPTTYAPVWELQREILEALESVAMRSSVLR
jgi:uncharacterized protein (DUF302 family)